MPKDEFFNFFYDDLKTIYKEPNELVKNIELQKNEKERLNLNTKKTMVISFIGNSKNSIQVINKIINNQKQVFNETIEFINYDKNEFVIFFFFKKIVTY